MCGILGHTKRTCEKPSQPKTAPENIVVSPQSGTPQPNERKGEVQKHGLVFEKEIAAIFHCTDEAPDTEYTGHDDVPWHLNKLDGYNVSVKTAGFRNQVCLADVHRFFESLNSGTPFKMVVMFYEQVDLERKAFKRLVELDLTNAAGIVFGTVKKEQIAELDRYVRAIPRGRSPTTEESNHYKGIARALAKQGGGYITFSPKCDSESQRRLQCAFSKRNFTRLIAEHPHRVITDTTTAVFKGRDVSRVILSPPRARNPTRKSSKRNSKITKTMTTT